MKFLLSASVIMLFSFGNMAGQPSIAVDMDFKTAGIQPSLVNVCSGADTLRIIGLYCENWGTSSSYEVKIFLDTAHFSFRTGFEDGGISGDKNFLKQKGAGITSIIQLKPNPKADDTIIFACTQIGNDSSKQAIGSGLLGLLQLRCKQTLNDTGKIVVARGQYLDMSQKKTEVTVLGKGTHIHSSTPIAHALNHVQQTSSRAWVSRSGNIPILSVYMPALSNSAGNKTVIQLFDCKGALIANVANETLKSGSHSFALNDGSSARLLSGGIYICRVQTSDRNQAFTLAIP